MRILDIPLLLIICIKLHANIYISYYATIDGQTGHVGIAVDNYSVIIQENQFREDSLANGTITYYDYWPKQNVQGFFSVFKKYPSQYWKYPLHEYDNQFYKEDLFFKGVPHKKCRIPDGLIEIQTKASQDFMLKSIIDSVIQKNKKYNAIYYNCTNYIVEILTAFFNRDLDIPKERILYANFYTPNKLFQHLQSIPNTTVLIDPLHKTNGSFLMERFIKRLFLKPKKIDEKLISIT